MATVTVEMGAKAIWRQTGVAVGKISTVCRLESLCHKLRRYKRAPSSELDDNCFSIKGLMTHATAYAVPGKPVSERRGKGSQGKGREVKGS